MNLSEAFMNPLFLSFLEYCIPLGYHKNVAFFRLILLSCVIYALALVICTQTRNFFPQQLDELSLNDSQNKIMHFKINGM